MKRLLPKINMMLALVVICLAAACAQKKQAVQTAGVNEISHDMIAPPPPESLDRAAVADESLMPTLAAEPARRDQKMRQEMAPATPAPMMLGRGVALSTAGVDRFAVGGTIPGGPPPTDREQYNPIEENDFTMVLDQPLSTFSIDVDTASYANVRRYIQQGQLPPADAVRLEELINYFSYDYGEPFGTDPFAIDVEVASCPWNDAHRLARIGLTGKQIEAETRPAANLVFLLDVSGSMGSPNKLPLVKDALKLLTNNLNNNDRVAIVVYAGASGLVLPSTEAGDRQAILSALDNLRSGGSTNGGAGIELAYNTATENFIEDGVNRVILCTDGDFNVGTTDQGSLTKLIGEKAKSGVFLTVLGFGMGNLNDATLEQLADKGNGNYGYIDNKAEARKVFVEEIGGTLVTIAKDVKIQVEFNPAVVAGYRLIGYENRMLAAQDFNDDTKDAGEIGAGHHVTALYEIVPIEAADASDLKVDDLKYQRPREIADAAFDGELMTVKLRYKAPNEDTSKLITLPVTDRGMGFGEASENTRFAAAVASFGMLLRDSEHLGSANFDTVVELASSALGEDAHGYRHAFIDMVKTAGTLEDATAE